MTNVKNEFKIRNPNADFILLEKILDKVDYPRNKRGNIREVESVIHSLGLSDDDLAQAVRLIDSLTFKRKNKNDNA